AGSLSYRRSIAATFGTAGTDHAFGAPRGRGTGGKHKRHAGGASAAAVHRVVPYRLRQDKHIPDTRAARTFVEVDFEMDWTTRSGYTSDRLGTSPELARDEYHDGRLGLNQAVPLQWHCG